MARFDARITGLIEGAVISRMTPTIIQALAVSEHRLERIEGTLARADNSVADVAEQVNKKMVKLWGSGGLKGLASYGTGFFVSRDGYILTPMKDGTYSLWIRTQSGSVGKFITTADLESTGLERLLSDFHAIHAAETS